MTKRILFAAALVLAACGGEKKAEEAPATSEMGAPADTMAMPADTMARDTGKSM
ncbi:MAG TPA: hypothetical protein VFU46_11335 [Gemmatimonadales bacterium]|nr:hypothetical protein [Gemmatimonadales bacterium]